MANSHSPQHAQTKPVLWLIEHVAREMDVACAVRAIARYRYGLEIKIKHIYRDIRTLIEQESPAVVALPFFYNASDLAIKEYVEAWPNAVFFNLAWEEIFYKGHTKIKAPSDEFSRTRVLHNAWGNFYADYLTGNGVQPENIFVNGNPAYQLYLAPYCRYYQDRSALARKHNLDAARRWVLIPENYRWAFITDSTINWRVSQGADRTELAGMREYAQRCLTMLLRWANKAAEQKELEIIFRPKPVTQAKEMVDFFAANVGTEIHSRMHLIKGESVREWVLASDLVLSSFSTTLIEAAVACKPLAMVEPLPVTEAFDADWYQYLDRVRTEEEFIGKCLSTDSGSHAALKSWAEREMLAQGDAISRLADFTAHLAQNHTASNTIDRPKIVLPPDKIYFNERTHENDRFSDRETEDKTKRWTKVLAQPAMPVTFDEQTASPPGDTPNTAPEIRLSLIVCTYNSGPFIAKCLESIAAQDYQGSDVEVIVVDNNCTDGTPEVLKQFRTRLSNFDTVREYKQGLSNARNCGFRQARGQYLAYIDDDAALPPHYVGTLISLLKEHEPDFAGGPVYPYYTTEKPAWFHDDFEVRKQAEETGWAPGASISGGNFIIRRELLGELGLFDENLGMNGEKLGMLEERKVLELYRAKTPIDDQKVYYSLECHVMHHVAPGKMSFQYILRRSYTAGYAAFQVFLETRGAPDYASGISALNGSMNQLTQIMERELLTAKSRAPLLLALIEPLKHFSWGMGYTRRILESGLLPESHPAVKRLRELLGACANTLQALHHFRAIVEEEDELVKALDFLRLAVDQTMSIKLSTEVLTEEALRKTFPDYDEAAYLDNNPDVKTMLENGEIISGWEHFIRVGCIEKRRYALKARQNGGVKAKEKIVDILWLVEHVAREMDTACAVKAIIEKHFGLKVEIKNIYYHINELLNDYNPRIVATPFFYNAGDVAIKDMVERWPGAVFFNIAWEEIFYKGHVKLKAPADDFTRREVYHHAWGQFYKDYLIEHGVREDYIFLNGNPVYQLYLPPYSSYYKGRAELASAYGLDPAKRWVFVPENYRWAFIDNNTIAWRVSQGANAQELLKMREFAQVSLKHLLDWCNKLGARSDVEVIFRPKPATHQSDMELFFQQIVSPRRSPNLKFIKAETVREWILASDIVASSFSTTLIESAIAGKPIVMAEPLPLTEAFEADWYEYITKACNEADFISLCTNGANCSSARLRTWAVQEMLSQGDPIFRLAGVLGNFAEQRKVELPQPVLNPRPLLSGPRQYWDPRTHEHDVFTPEDVYERTQRWAKIIEGR